MRTRSLRKEHAHLVRRTPSIDNKADTRRQRREEAVQHGRSRAGLHMVLPGRVPGRGAHRLPRCARSPAGRGHRPGRVHPALGALAQDLAVRPSRVVGSACGDPRGGSTRAPRAHARDAGTGGRGRTGDRPAHPTWTCCGRSLPSRRSSAPPSRSSTSKTDRRGRWPTSSDARSPQQRSTCSRPGSAWRTC